MSDAAIEFVLRRDRVIVASALFLLVALAWTYILWLVARYGHGRHGYVRVRFGSLADIGQPIRDVRFAPESGHVQRQDRCLLCASSGRGTSLRKKRLHESRGGVMHDPLYVT
jgi:predicted metal-binding membrane protein